jgi:hypothetical protein
MKKTQHFDGVSGNCQVRDLKCEYRVNPVGIDVDRPRLSWVITSEIRGQNQTAYRVLVASSKKNLHDSNGDLWDSGKVNSSRSTGIVYEGKQLDSNVCCYWKVSVWDREGSLSAESKLNSWSMGVVKASDWKAEWIGKDTRKDYHDELKHSQWIWHPESIPETSLMAYDLPTGIKYFRRKISLPRNVTKARLVMIGDYKFVPFINGQIAISTLPAIKERLKTIDNRTSGSMNPDSYPDGETIDVDILPMIHAGDNCVAIAAKTDGYPNRRAAIIGSILLEFDDESDPLVIATDNDWLVFDKEVVGWKTCEFDDSKWHRAEPLGSYSIAPWNRTLAKKEQHNLFILRREFKIKKPVKKAHVHICGLGAYELYLNGEKVGDHALDPGWTNYRRTCLYSTYEVADLLQTGRNAFGVMLGNGMYNVSGGRFVKFEGTFGPAKMILQMHVEFADGSATEIVSDASWKVDKSPITFSCIFGGEDYDARKEQPGWNSIGFDDSKWDNVKLLEGPGGKLVSQGGPPVKIMDVFEPVNVTEPKPGAIVYDLGQNFSGWPELEVSGKAGQTVRMAPSELLTENGLVDQNATGTPYYFTYTLKGDGREVWQPRFSYYGFRYVQVEGAKRDGGGDCDDKPIIVNVRGQFVRSSAATTGRFQCSNKMFNRIHEIINKAIQSNMQSILTDCPHREKTGWIEQTHLMARAIMYNYDVFSLYEKIGNDIREAQFVNGFVPTVAPEYVAMLYGFRESVEWSSACVISPWVAYEMYGDASILENHYDSMKSHVEYLVGRSHKQLLEYGLGDWFDLGPGEPGESKLTPKGLTATAIYFYDVTIMEKVAKLLGKEEDAEGFSDLKHDIKKAFNGNFFDAKKQRYGAGSQAANALPLALGLVDREYEEAVLKNIVDDVRNHRNHLTTGEVGHHYLLNALLEKGRSDVIFDMTSQTAAPSYGYQLNQGVTTLTEDWNTEKHSSQNHFMLGHIEQWFYEGLAGINPGPESNGFDRILIKPQIVGDLTWVKASYNSVRGKISVYWRREKGALKLNITIPANTEAVAYLPAKDVSSVLENDIPAEDSEGIQFIRMEDGNAIISLCSGNYNFRSQLPE